MTRSDRDRTAARRTALHSRVLEPSGPAGADRTPVVLVHGIGMSPRSFRDLQGVLAEQRPTIAVALPGFGGNRVDDLGSTPTAAADDEPANGPRDGYGPAGFADVVAAELRRRGIALVDLVGQSMGTQVVVEVARRHPDLVRAVTLIGPVVEPERATVAQLAVALARDSLREGLRMNVVVATDYLRSIRQYLHELGPMLRYPMAERLAGLSVPALVTRGDRDPIARKEWVDRLVAVAPTARGAVFPGAHHVQEDAPRAVARAVLALGQEARDDDPATSDPAVPTGPVAR